MRLSSYELRIKADAMITTTTVMALTMTVRAGGAVLAVTALLKHHHPGLPAHHLGLTIHRSSFVFLDASESSKSARPNVSN